jgi:hypothetical protein
MHPNLCQSLPVPFRDFVLIHDFRQLAHGNHNFLIDILGPVAANAEMGVGLEGDRRVGLWRDTVELFVSVISPELGLLKLSPGQRRPGLKAGVFR